MKKVSIYYLLILSLLAGKVVSTIYEGSMIVNHGSKIARLQMEKRELKNEQQELSKQIADKYSLQSVIASTDITNYTKISKPIVIDAASKTVAQTY